MYDQETELYYLQSRYYDPEVGRFINADAFTSTGQGILGNNMFAYCNNCPVKYKDPDGHELVTATAVVIVIEAVLIVATVAIISYCVATLLVELSGWIADSLHQITWANIEYAKEVAEPEPPDVTYPGDDPQKEPNGTEWRGKGEKGSKEGNYYNPKTGESWHPDLKHPEPIGPHWDYRAPDGTWWRVGRGKITLK